MNLFIAMLLPLGLLLLALGLLTSEPKWFPQATKISAALLAFAVIILLLVRNQ